MMVQAWYLEAFFLYVTKIFCRLLLQLLYCLNKRENNRYIAYISHLQTAFILQALDNFFNEACFPTNFLKREKYLDLPPPMVIVPFWWYLPFPKLHSLQNTYSSRTLPVKSLTHMISVSPCSVFKQNLTGLTGPRQVLEILYFIH